MKGYEKIKELLNGELDDYSYFSIGELKLSEQNDTEEFYEVEITKANEDDKTLYFRYVREEDKIYISINEDNYEEVTTYDWRVKYLWMVLLKW